MFFLWFIVQDQPAGLFGQFYILLLSKLGAGGLLGWECCWLYLLESNFVNSLSGILSGRYNIIIVKLTQNFPFNVYKALWIPTL